MGYGGSGSISQFILDTSKIEEDISELQTDVSNHLLSKTPHANVPAVKVYNSANQSISPATTTLLSFNLEMFDTDTMHDNSSFNTRLTAKTAGVYMIQANVSFALNATGIFRSLSIQRNAAQPIAGCRVPNISGQNIEVGVMTIFKLAANDYVEVTVRHDATGAIDIISGAYYSPYFSMVRVATG